MAAPRVPGKKTELLEAPSERRQGVTLYSSWPAADTTLLSLALFAWTPPTELPRMASSWGSPVKGI